MFMFGGMRRSKEEEGDGTMMDSTARWAMNQMTATTSTSDSSSSSKPIGVTKSSVDAAREWMASLETSSRQEQSTGGPGPQQSPLVLALRDIVKWLNSVDWKVVLRDFATDVLIPLALAIATCAIVFYTLHKIYRWFVPYTANELHEQALQTLQNGGHKMSYRHDDNDDDATQKQHQQERKNKRHIRKTQRAEKQAESLWQKALERDPEHTSTVVSLSALYVYRQEEPEKALSLLEEYKTNSFRNKNSKGSETTTTTNQKGGKAQQPQPERPLNPALQSIQDDAKAMQQGHKSMVQSELAETEHLTFFAALARD